MLARNGIHTRPWIKGWRRIQPAHVPWNHQLPVEQGEVQILRHTPEYVPVPQGRTQLARPAFGITLGHVLGAIFLGSHGLAQVEHEQHDQAQA